MTTEIRPVPGTDDIPANMPPWWKRFELSFTSDWPAVFRPSRYNWTDFTFINISGEAEWIMGTAEFVVALIGFRLRATWYWPSEERDELSRQARLIQHGMFDVENAGVANKEESRNG